MARERGQEAEAGRGPHLVPQGPGDPGTASPAPPTSRAQPRATRLASLTHSAVT